MNYSNLEPIIHRLQDDNKWHENQGEPLILLYL